MNNEIRALFRRVSPCLRFVEESRESYPTGLFERCWAFVAICERQSDMTGRQQSYPYLPVTDTFLLYT